MEPISASAILISGSLLFGGGAMTLTGKIVWDWLQIRKNGHNGTNSNGTLPMMTLNTSLNHTLDAVKENTKQTHQIAIILKQHIIHDERKEERSQELLIELKGLMDIIKDRLRPPN